jgi:hypothetical protein
MKINVIENNTQIIPTKYEIKIRLNEKIKEKFNNNKVFYGGNLLNNELNYGDYSIS